VSLLRLANSNSKRISIGDDGDYVEVREDIDKKTFNAIILAMPEGAAESGSLSVGEALNFSKFLFDIFVTGWSLDVPPTLDNYELLSRESADAIDTVVAKHFESLTPNKEESKSGEGPSGSGRKRH